MIVKSAYAQTNDTNKERSHLNCYVSFAMAIMHKNLLNPYTIDLSEREIKKHYSSICTFIHEKSGIWINVDDDPKKYGWDWHEFESKYYHSGVPEQIEKIFDIMAGDKIKLK